MRFVWWSDFHISDTPPSMRTESYTEDILAKGYEIAELCTTEKADYAIFGGDFFNSKIASRVSHSLVNASLTLLSKFPCPVIFIVGSHDVPYGRLDLMYKRPIGTLLRHPNVIYVDNVTTLDLQDREHCIRLLPVSDSYNNTTDEVVAALKEQRAQSDGVDPDRKMYDIALLHQPVVKGGTYPYPVIQAADLVGTADLILYGHMHNYEGVWDMTVEGQTTKFVNVGAVSRGSLDEKTLARKPTVVSFAVNEVPELYDLKEIALKSAKPAAQVFRLTENQESLERGADIEALLGSVRKTQFGAFSVQSAVEKIRSLEYTSRTDVLPEEHEISEAHFSAVKNTAVKLLEEIGT